MSERGLRETSVWERDEGLPSPEPLSRDLPTEVCVIGAGIAGLTTAYELAMRGKAVTVIDRGALVCGETRLTTAHLSNALDDRYARLLRIRGKEIARLAAASHTAAIERIGRIAEKEGIPCDFERVDGYFFLGEDDSEEMLEEELGAAREAGLAGVERLDEAPTRGFASGPCLRFPDQGHFHPLKYSAGLIGLLETLGVRIFARTAAVGVRGGAVATVRTEAGFEIRARAVVVAANSVIHHRFAMQTKVFPYRTFAIACRVGANEIGNALYWDTLDNYHYVRLCREEKGELLIVGGEDHKTGQANDAAERFARLEAWARENFPAAREVVCRWSGQVLETLDGLAYIGRDSAGGENVYVVTGDSGMGLTHGTIAGMLLPDLILGNENPWEAVYDPSRKPTGAVRLFAEENWNVARRYCDWLTAGGVESAEEITPGSGAVVRSGLSKVAVYRDRNGQLHRRSAVCPHLGCLVNWNEGAETWDCPCHGSRFDPYGEVLNGPATRGLGEEVE